MKTLLNRTLSRCLGVVAGLVAGLFVQLHSSAFAAGELTVTSITWDVVGLDHNRPATEGPQYFPVGAEVCNNSGATRDLRVDFAWGGSDDSYIKTRDGSLNTLNFFAVPDGECIDAYYEIELTRAAGSFGQTRQYSITASYVDGAATVSASTPADRQIIIEGLVSQNRNTTLQIRYCDPSVPGNDCAQENGTGWVILGGGGSMNLAVGGTYFIELTTATSTAYEEIQSFLTLSNTIFQVLSVSTDYTELTAPEDRVPAPNPKLWADGCQWDSDPNSPNYHSCLSDGKAGGTVTTLYKIAIITGGGDTVGLEALIYDRSGGSFHYNTDFSQSPGEISVFNPVDAEFSKRFVPSTISADGVAALRFTITNIYPVTVSGYNFADNLPSGMVVASNPNVSKTCGGTVTAVAGANAVSFADGEIGPNATCTIRVDVTVPKDADTTYPITLTNTSQNLFIGTTDTGKNATAPLTVIGEPPPPMNCAPIADGTTLAMWDDFSSSTAPAPTFTYSGVAANASSGMATAGTFANAQGEWRFTTPVNRIESQAVTDGAYIEFLVDTTGISSIDFSLTAYAQNGQAPQTIRLYYGPAGSLQQSVELNVPQQNQKPAARNFAVTGLAGNLNISGETVFRVYLYNGSGNSPIRIDDVLITGSGSVCTPISGTPPNPPTFTKIFSPTPVRVGEVSTLTFKLTNPNANDTLTGITFRDELPTGMTVATPPDASGGSCGGTWAPAAGDAELNFTGGTLAANATCTLTVKVVSTSIGDNLNLTDPIDATETLPGESAEATLTVTPPPETPSIVKSFSPNPLLDPADSTTLTFEISNNDQDTAISSVSFTDKLPAVGGVQMQPVTPFALSYTNCGPSPSLTWDDTSKTLAFSNCEIAAGAVCAVTVAVKVPGVDVSGGSVQFQNVTSKVSHVFHGNTYEGNTASSTLLVDNPIPKIKVVKKASLDGQTWYSHLAVPVGAEVSYLILVENIGEVPLSNVTVTDPNVSLTGCIWPNPLPVATAANNNHIASCVVGPVTAQAGEHTNTATVVGEYNGTAVTDSSTAKYATTGLTLVKSADKTLFAAAGETITYSYEVKNSGSAPLQGPVTVIDDKTTVTCPAVSTVGDADNWLEPNESITCTATYSVKDEDVTVGSVTNTATASAAGVTSNQAIVTVNKVTINAVNDNTTTTPNTPIATTVTGNDTHVGGTVNPSSVTVTTNPVNGSVSCVGEICTYTPNNNYTGADSYSYQVCLASPNETVCDTAVVNVMVASIPTYALISAFKAYINDDRQTVLEWKTDSEIGTIGFLLERLNEQTGEYEAVSEMLPGMLTPPHGGQYRYVDPAAAPGKEHTYRVVEVAVNSEGAVAGPYTVRASEPLPSNPAMQADGPEGYSLANEPLSAKQARRAALRKQAEKSLVSQVQKKTGSTLKVPVSKDGLVYLTADRLAAASGLSKQQVTQRLKAKKCLVTLQGKRVPALYASNGGALWFYGQAPARNDIGRNIYYLELGKQGAAVVTAAASSGRVVIGQSFAHRERLEENHMPFHLYINKPVRDFWAWEYLLAYGKEATVTHSIAAPSLTGNGSAVLTVNLVNISSSSSGTAAPYKAQVFLNGTELGGADTDAVGDWQLRLDVPASLLRESGNEVKIASQLNSGTVYSLIYLDSFELEYERKYEAADGALTFTSGKATKVTVDGFTSKNVLAMDISNPAKPTRLRIAVSKSQTVSNGFAVTVRTKPGRRYVITQHLAASGDEIITVDSPSQLRSVKNRADYLIIAPLHLIDSAKRLAEHRQSQGLTSIVVDIEDVQDEFSHGLSAPEAVHDFLTYVHKHWAQAPRYVALVGDGSYDYKNYLKYGWSAVPSVLVATPQGYFPSDNALADVAGNDGVPEFAVGRIPVFDKTEFDRYIDKVISYEQSAGSSSMTVVNDKNDPSAGSFKASAELVAGFAPEGMTVAKLDVDSLGATAVQARIKTAMQQGTGILHYIGHSSLIGFGKGNGLLSAKTIETMTPVGPPTLMVSMSCSAASFGYPAMNSIGESAVLRADGAAVGFFGATGLSFNHLGDIIAEGFYRSLFDQTAAPRLGDAVLESKRHYRQIKQEADVSAMDIYNLLGDPAVRMPALP